MIISLSPFALENLVSGEPAATRSIRVTGAAFSGATVWTNFVRSSFFTRTIYSSGHVCDTEVIGTSSSNVRREKRAGRAEASAAANIDWPHGKHIPTRQDLYQQIELRFRSLEYIRSKLVCQLTLLVPNR